jgi:hypothetical protein
LSRVRAVASDSDPGRETHLRQEASGGLENGSRATSGEAEGGCGEAVSLQAG